VNAGAGTSLTAFLVAAGTAVALAAIPVAIGADASDETKAVADLLATVALLGAGRLLDDRAGRLRSVLWALAVLAWAGALGVVFTQVVDGPDGKWLVATVAALTFPLAFALWWVERRSLQFVAMFGAAVVALAAVAYTTEPVSVLGFELGPEVPDPTWSALVTVALGAAAILAGMRDLVTPRRTAIVVGSLALIAGAGLIDVDVLGGAPTTLALVAALIASTAVLVIGDRLADRAVAGIGIAGVLLAAAGLVGDVADEQGAAVAAIVLGVAAVVAGVLLSRRAAQD
jgi:hypothetical protein